MTGSMSRCGVTGVHHVEIRLNGSAKVVKNVDTRLNVCHCDLYSFTSLVDYYSLKEYKNNSQKHFPKHLLFFLDNRD